MIWYHFPHITCLGIWQYISMFSYVEFHVRDTYTYTQACMDTYMHKYGYMYMCMHTHTNELNSVLEPV